MPAQRLALAASKRTGFPEFVTVNCYPERDPTDPDAPMALIARPGAEEFQTVGTAPIRAIHQKSGLFNDSALVFPSEEVWTLDGSGAKVMFSGAPITGGALLDVDSALDPDGNSIARAANGSGLFLINGATNTVVAEAFTGAGATSVAHISGYWLAVETDTDYFYYLEPAGASWVQLQFAAAEYAPDKLVCVRVCGEFIGLLGRATTEIWRLTGDASSPLEPYGGLKFDFGCRARPAAVNCGGVLIWPDDNGQVRAFSGGEPAIISDSGLTEEIRRSPAADLRASYRIVDGHPQYVLTLGTRATWVYDLSTRAWVRFNSFGLAYYRAHLHCNIGDVVLAADALSNQVWRLNPDLKFDGEDVFTKEWCAQVPAKEAPVSLAVIELHGEFGDAPLQGEGSEPIAVLQISHDRGKTYGNMKERGMGATGHYRQRVRWNAQGVARQPNGALLKFSSTSMSRISGVWLNGL